MLSWRSHAAKIERKIQIRNALLTAASFAFVLAIGSAAPLGLSFSDGVQLTEQTAAAGAHKEMKDKGKKMMKGKKDKMSGKEMSNMKKGKGMGKGKGAEMRDKMKKKTK